MNIQLETLDYLKDQHILFCFACRGNMLTTDTFHSFNKWTGTASQMEIKFAVETIKDSGDARNEIATQMLTTPGPTHILFLDSDIVFEPWHILALISAKKHIIGGNGEACYHLDGMAREGDIIEVGILPASFLMVSREAIIHTNGEVFDLSKWKELGGRIWMHDQVNPKRA